VYGGKRVEGAELGTLATEHIAIGAREKKALAFIAWKISGAFDLSSATIVASLFGRFFFGGEWL
jgi:hypothetical protein